MDSRDVVLIDVKSSTLTLEEVADEVNSYRQDPAYSGYDIFLDGDRCAIVARPKADSHEDAGSQ